MTCQGGNREKILLCAKELFYRKGYQATSVDDIIAVCKVAKSNFYYHFPSKEQLALEVLEQRVTEYEGLLKRSLHNRELSPAERLTHYLNGLVEFAAAQQTAGCPFGNFAAALPVATKDESYERFRLRLSQLFRQMEGEARDCIVEGVERGEFRADVSPSEMALFLMASIEGMQMLAKTHRNVQPLKEGSRVLLQLFLMR